MEIIFSAHAKQRIIERKIEYSLIERAFESYDRIENLADDVIRIIYKISSTKVLMIYYRMSENVIVVITLIISSKVNKYLP